MFERQPHVFGDFPVRIMIDLLLSLKLLERSFIASLWSVACEGSRMHGGDSVK